jgi:hypothetical protein
MQTVEVILYSGYKADEYPIKFIIGDTCYEIIEIEDRWYGPDYSYFRVFADNAHRYILKRNHRDGNWQIQKSG